MAILVDIQEPGWWTDEAFRDALGEHLPDADIRCRPDLGDPEDIEMLAVARLRSGLAERLTGLALVQKPGAGVETIVGDSTLAAAVRIARLKDGAPATDIAEYCIAYVLRERWPRTIAGSVAENRC